MTPSKVNFQTSIRYDGNNLRLSVPQALAGKRFEAYYGQGQLIVAEAKGDTQGIKPTKAGSLNSPCWYIQFGQKWVGKTMPKFRVKSEVTMENGQFTFKVPEQNNEQKPAPWYAKKTPTAEKRTYTRKSDTLSAALNLLNKYAAENEYEWEVKDGKASLVKYNRIG